MANKFAEDIRRIARGTRFKGQLGEYSPRDPIGETQITLITDPMALGGGYGNGGLNNETPTSEAPNSETEQNENEGDQNPPQDPNNPNSYYKGGAGEGDDSAAGEGSFDVGDIIDGTDGPQTTIPGTSGGVNEIKGMIDCESETPFNLQLDGNFPVPEGWDDAETPPQADGYEDWDPDYFWQSNPAGFGIIEGSTAQLTYEAAEASLIANPSVTDYELRQDLTQSSPTQWFWRWVAFIDGIGTGVSTTFVLRSNCSSVGNPSPACIAEIPLADSWPEDGTFELANKDGKLVTSEFDADAPAPYSSSGKDFCFGEDRTGKILVTADGGTMIYETGEGGAPTGTVRVYGPDGTAQGFGDATESFISQYLPK